VEHIDTASQPGSIEDTAKRLISWSGHRTWGLARVEYVSEFARERVLSTLRYALAERSIPLDEIELPSYRSASEVVQFLIDRLEKIESGVVSISGFATAFDIKTSLEDALRVLNFNRENIAPANLRQIWWLPSSFAETFVPSVPDLDSWFTFRLYLTEGGPAAAQSRPTDLESDREHLVTNLPSSDGLFVGRESVLSAIAQGLEREGRVNLYGVGGSGKTRTALEYANRHYKDYKTILWCPADTEDSLNIGLLRIAETLKLPEANPPDLGRVTEAVRTWLQNSDGWLLILDDLDENRGIIPSIVSTRQGHILITSRRLILRSPGSIDLHGLTLDESRELLFKAATRRPTHYRDAEAADEVIELLQHVPLALKLAGANIKYGKTDYRGYLSRLRAHAHKIFDLQTLIGLAFEKLDELSKDLLRLCVFYSSNDIPKELIKIGRASCRERV